MFIGNDVEFIVDEIDWLVAYFVGILVRINVANVGYIAGSNNGSNVGFIIDWDVLIRVGGTMLGVCDERYVETSCGINIGEVTLGVLVDDEVGVFISGFASNIVCAGW